MHAYIHKTNRRSRSLRLTVNQSGEVVVTTPPRFTQKTVDTFVQQHAEWIQQQLEKLQHIRSKLSLKNDEVLYFGKVMKVVVESSLTKKIGVVVIQERLVVNPVSQTKESVQRSIERFLKSEIQQYIIQMTHELGQKMSITFKNVSFKTQKTRWGSCSSSGNLNFNTKLIHSPKEVVDYVIIHELAHRKHLDHSKNFWLLVEQYCPEYRKHRGWLKRHGMAL